MTMKKRLAVCLVSSALFAACGSAPENIDEEGCEHLQKGPGVTVTASASASGAPEVSNDHKRYDLTLPEGTGGKTGSVSFKSGESTHYVFFLSADVALKVTSSGGQAVAFESSTTSSSLCGDIRGRHVAPLGVGTYTLTLGPTSQGSVSLVIEEFEADHTH